MEVRALCVRLWTTVLVLLAAQLHLSCCHNDDAALPRVDPNTLQFFEYDPFVVSCEGLHGLTGWRVMKKVRGVVQTCAHSWGVSTGPCRITEAISATDTGEYWCELGGRLRSNAVNVTVTAGSVILESPAHPVVEGDNVTLRCRTTQTTSNLTATFYKDGFFIGTSSTGQITDHTVSTSDEGLYKCSISGAGESPQSRLAVTAYAPAEEPPPQLYLLLCAGVSVVLVALLVVAARVRCQKHGPTVTGHTEDTQRAVQAGSSVQAAWLAGPEFPGVLHSAVSAEAGVDDSAQPTYALVTKPREVKDPRVSRCSAEDVHVYCSINDSGRV